MYFFSIYLPVCAEDYSRVEQLAARKAHNLEVTGSNPVPAIAGIVTTCTVPVGAK